MTAPVTEGAAHAAAAACACGREREARTRVCTRACCRRPCCRPRDSDRSEAHGLQLRHRDASSYDKEIRCACPRDRFGSHQRPPPLWPRDGGGTSRTPRSRCQGAVPVPDPVPGPARHAGTGTAPRTRGLWRGPGRWRWHPSSLAVLLLVGRLLPASAAPGAAPGAAPAGVSMAAVLGAPLGYMSTLPPPPPLPPLPSYRSVVSSVPQAGGREGEGRRDTTATLQRTRLRAKSVMCFESLVNLLIDKLDKLSDKVQAQGTTLDKLEEKLQAQVSTLWEIRYRMDSLERRLGEVDSKLDRQDRHVGDVDTSIGRRFDKLTETIAAHDHKDSSAKEQLSRKVDNAYERIVYMENNSISKIQATAGHILDKATSCAADSQRVVEQAVGRARDELAAELGAVHARVNATHDHVLNASRAAAGPQDDAEEYEAGRKACADASETATKTIKQHIDAKTELMSTKVSGLYNDMWRRVNALESTTKAIISLSNATRRDVQSLGVEVRGLHHAQQSRGGYHGRQSAPEPGNLEYALNLHDDAVDRHLKALRDTMLDELRNVQQVQDAFLRTCSRLNEKDLSTEDKLSRVLSHHTDYLIKHGDDLADIKRALKTHRDRAGTAFNATDSAKATPRDRGAQPGGAGPRGVEAGGGGVGAPREHHGLSAAGRPAPPRQAKHHPMPFQIFTNVTERVSSCAGRPEPTDEDAAWSALLEHKEAAPTPPEPAEAVSPEPLGGHQDRGAAEPGGQLTTTTTPGPSTTTPPSRPLDLSDGELSASRRDHSPSQDIAETGQEAAGRAGGQELRAAPDSGRDSSQDSNGLQRQHRQPGGRRGEPVHAPAGAGQETGAGAAAGRGPEWRTLGGAGGSSDSSQDSVTDLSSVDDEDYTEENDDETDFVD
ncbi:UPF0134 protein [Frankliniella fusca]|uniref:UPF0134 protein n=1 Tax=Frankliniella fusca TaxID=407009 RepID=A0AAE1H320_9NEOP|nr:UPF0134 protein [Frankliniella fusca]